jgi:hypothetical protein
LIRADPMFPEPITAILMPFISMSSKSEDNSPD